MPQKNKASKYTKMLIAFDTEENFDLVNDSLNAISKKHTIGKGYMAQKAIEAAVLPQDAQVKQWLIEWHSEQKTILQIAAEFFQKVTKDLSRGENRKNAQKIIEDIYEYARSFPARREIMVGNKTIIEYLSKYINGKHKLKTIGDWQKLTDVIAQYSAEETITDLREDQFAFPFFLHLDKIVTDWNKPIDVLKRIREQSSK